jgi:hypothetical protein
MRTIFFVIPFFWFLSFRVRNGLRFIIQPPFWFDGILIRDLERSSFVPVIRLPEI